MANKLTKAVRAAKKVGKKVIKGGMKLLKEVGPALDEHAMKAAEMLVDPCNASLSDACYRGDQGFKNRFTSSAPSFLTAGIVSGVYVFVPGTNLVYTAEYTAANTPTLLSQFGGPGNVFLASNATGTRSLGACVSLSPLASNLATSGVIYTGVVPLSAINITVNQTPASLIPLCPNFGRLSIDQPMECKFVPLSADESYVTPSTNFDTTDQSAILIVITGLPAGSGVNFRITNIIEWKAANSLGIASVSSAGNPSKNTIEHVKEFIRKRDPHWYTNVGKTAYNVLRGYSRGGMVGAITGAFMK